MKMLAFLAIPVAVLVAGCSLATKDHWQWLEDPTKQIWKEVNFNISGNHVELRIPDRNSMGLERARIWPTMDEERSLLEIEVKVTPNKLSA